MSQTEFGKRIGLSASTISAIESGRTPINEANLKLICMTYGVSDTWLRFGEGDMFLKEDDHTDKSDLTQDEKNFLKEYRKLAPQLQNEIKKYIAEKLELYQFRRERVMKKTGGGK